MNYYNEFDPKAAAWIRELIKAGMIPDGEVDERSITDVRPKDLDGFVQCHFFAGIGGWSAALNIAKSEIHKNLWTGSCPCQPFSTAGKRNGVNDERHLWPDFFRLIAARKPEIVFGEQVASSEVVGTQLETAFIVAVQAGEFARANKLANKLVKTKGFHYQPRWVDRVRADMEAEGYSFEFHVLGAHSVGAPHIRQRLWWVGYTKDGNREIPERESRKNSQLRRPSGFGGVADSKSVRSGEGRQDATGGIERDTQEQRAVTECHVSCFGMADSNEQGKSRRGIQRPTEGDCAGDRSTRERSEGFCTNGGMDNTSSPRHKPERKRPEDEARNGSRMRGFECGCDAGGMVNLFKPGLEGY
ncbi:MAG TPA: DNA cytosine methyltransferase, partial [Candidatus Hydrogenedentes bacterium]|nr:DNA cytosine methyltransferase [Candidatus Hydrogenedentota bacterium]